MEEIYKTWVDIPNHNDTTVETSSKSKDSEHRMGCDGMMQIIVSDQDGYVFTYRGMHIPHAGETIERTVGWSYLYTVNNVRHVVDDDSGMLSKIELSCTSDQETY